MSHASRVRRLVLSISAPLRALIAERISLLRSAPLRWPSAMKHALWSVGRQVYYGTPTVVVITLLVLAMGGRWRIAGASPPSPEALLAERGYSVKPGSSSAAGAKSTSSPFSPPSSSSPPSTMPTFVLGRPWKKAAGALTGKLNLNTATEEQLMMLPTVGPAKAERIIVWRQKNGGFRRVADIRRVKGFGFKTFKRLEPFLDVQGETTLQ